MTDPTGSVQDRFARFYTELHDDEPRKPYGWQCRLAAELAAEGPTWEWLIAPTGAGKTALIGCFVFALSEQLERERRQMPLRLFWVIDRRGVVDQVFAEAERLASRLRGARPDTLLDAVAKNLRSAASESADGEPLEVRLWRGGTGRGIEPVPLAAPAVVCSTVDQVGSRLLFRGYGTSFKSRPIDAALVGTDSLIVLDEAHLAGPFAETVRAAREQQEKARRQPAPMLRMMQVSATPPARSASGESFTLTPEELSESPLAERLQASKPVRLVKSTGNLGKALAKQAARLAAERQGVIGVVANMVQDARDGFEELCRQGDGEAVLLIGPSRPLDREAVLARIPARRDRDTLDRTIYVVGTQTLEVGLDLDFDGLVTVCAPFASLVQRFGRLDRAGYVTHEHGSASGVIIHPPKGCPIYGEWLEETWTWLEESEKDDEINLGPGHLDRYRLSDSPPPPAPQGPRAPLLAPWHLEALVQTSRDTVPTPEIGFFLHGDEGAQRPDVSIVWRADITEANRDEWEERLQARPPHRGEMLSLPISKVRRWLSGEGRNAHFSDIESGVSEDAQEVHSAIRFGRISPPGPDDEWKVSYEVDAKDVRPGDVLLVPSASGGCDRFGWAPTSKDTVDDLVDDLGDLNPARPCVLLGRQATALGSPPEELRLQVDSLIEELLAETIGPRDVYAQLAPLVIDWLKQDDRYEDVRSAIIEQLESSSGEVILLPDDQPDSLVLKPPRVRDMSATVKAQEYSKHVDRVEELTIAYARSQKADDDIIETLQLAARYHDVGKLDSRFQAWLNRGLPPEPGKWLAKSDYPTWSSKSETFRRMAGWPRGKRHEMISAVLIQRALELGTFGDRDNRAFDADLLLYLPAIHHGQMRPFLPMLQCEGMLFNADEPDANPVPVRAVIEGERVSVSSDQELEFIDHADRFLRLNERYGPWGLAALEAMLVLADRVASAESG